MSYLLFLVSLTDRSDFLCCCLLALAMAILPIRSHTLHNQHSCQGREGGREGGGKGGREGGREGGRGEGREGGGKGGREGGREGERGKGGREGRGEERREGGREGGGRREREDGKGKRRREEGREEPVDSSPHLPSASATGNNMPTTIRKQLKMMGPANTINMKNPEASKYCC